MNETKERPKISPSEIWVTAGVFLLVLSLANTVWHQDKDDKIKMQEEQREELLDRMPPTGGVYKAVPEKPGQQDPSQQVRL